jgi:hypothetical protein
VTNAASLSCVSRRALVVAAVGVTVIAMARRDSARRSQSLAALEQADDENDGGGGVEENVGDVGPDVRALRLQALERRLGRPLG